MHRMQNMHQASKFKWPWHHLDWVRGWAQEKPRQLKVISSRASNQDQLFKLKQIKAQSQLLEGAERLRTLATLAAYSRLRTDDPGPARKASDSAICLSSLALCTLSTWDALYQPRVRSDHALTSSALESHGNGLKW